jgi:hypothetical protein
MKSRKLVRRNEFTFSDAADFKSVDYERKYCD